MHRSAVVFAAAWPVRFRLAVADAEGDGMVFLTLIYASDDGYFASPIFMPDLVGGARAAMSR
ncbi:MAG: hypothetical protein WBI91_01990 [Coriobacteriia bacterium]